MGNVREPEGKKRRLNKHMRYRELIEARRPWKHYSGREHVAYIALLRSDGPPGRLTAVKARYGLIHTGRARVFHGYFVEVSGPSGETWLGEHRYSLRGALRDAARRLEDDGWSLSAIGLTCDWRETGLSENSGYGYHPAFDGPANFLDFDPRATSSPPID